MNSILSLNAAIHDSTVGTIVLQNDLAGDVSVTRKMNIDLNGQTLTGSLTMQHQETGTVTIGAGRITGDLTINTPNATVVNHADVNGQTTIEDVAENTFDNSGELHAVKFIDPNGGRLINRNVAGVGTLVIDSPALVTLAGNFETINIAQSMSLVLEGGTTVKEMTADDSISVEVATASTAVIEKKPNTFTLVDYSVDILKKQKELRQEVAELNVLMQGDLNDKSLVETFITRHRKAEESLSTLPDTLETRRIGSDLSKLYSAYDRIPASPKLQKAFDDFVPTISNPRSLNGASIAIPSLYENGIAVYSTSHDNLWERFEIPARPHKADEVRHVLFSYVFQEGHKALQRNIIIHIPYGDAEITYEILERGKLPSSSDYVTSDSFEFDQRSSYQILFTEGLTVGDFLSSSLIPMLSTDYEVFSYVNHAEGYVKESYDAVYDSDFISERLNVIHDETISSDMKGYQEVTGGSFVLDIELKEVRYKGDIKIWDLQEELKPFEGETFAMLNFMDVHSMDVPLESNMQLIHKPSRGMYLFKSKNYQEATPGM